MTQITDNTAQSRFELDLDGAIAFANYRIEGDTLYIDYVEAPVALRGTGAASQLMAGIMEMANARNLTVVPICGYAAAWIKRHRL